MRLNKSDYKKKSDGNLFSSMVFKGYGIELRPVQSQDLPVLRRWRNTPSIRRKMNDTSYITPHQQRKWFENTLNSVDKAQWVVWSNGGKTGYVNVKGQGILHLQPHVSGGYYIADTPFRHALVSYAVMLMYHDIVFNHMEVPLIKGNILKENKSSLKLNRDFGYQEVSESTGSISFIIKADDYANRRKKYLRYFKDTECRRL
ncbi:GNAT family N-acetyltransferase [Paracoccaceae bacterium]|nr:GNAT family N-acetyltransferase [Paracoccaceae bacterium]